MTQFSTNIPASTPLGLMSCLTLSFGCLHVLFNKSLHAREPSKCRVCPLKQKCHHFDEIFITGCTGVVILTTFGAGSDENFIKMTTFLFQCHCEWFYLPRNMWGLISIIDCQRNGTKSCLTLKLTHCTQICWNIRVGYILCNRVVNIRGFTGHWPTMRSLA